MHYEEEEEWDYEEEEDEEDEYRYWTEEWQCKGTLKMSQLRERSEIQWARRKERRERKERKQRMQDANSVFHFPIFSFSF